MQNGPPGRAHVLVILPKPSPCEAYSSVLPALRVAKVLEGHIVYEVLGVASLLAQVIAVPHTLIRRSRGHSTPEGRFIPLTPGLGAPKY
eukprot:6206809-Pleurochrysis_carterae.AAC.1